MYEIKKLDKNIISAIAAGEVIERPYSIIKELLENSLDAKAKNIDIHIKSVDSLKIRIIDDGIGIDDKYLRISVERHATSKLLNNNLSGLKTLGFRGEALYAIASASLMTIISRTSEMKEAKKIKIKDNIASGIMPSKGKVGTEIIIEEIFKNIPVRKKFMRSQKSEFFSIRNTIKKIAFSHPNVCFNYYENDKIKYLFSNSNYDDNKKNRIIEIFGEEFRKNSLHFKENKKDFSLEGYISIPTYNKPNWNDTIIILNDRVIRDRMLLGVLKASYAGLIVGTRFPVVALILRVNPEYIDFNVHPTKSEVRILNRKTINSVIIKKIRQTLEKAGLIGSVASEKSLLRSLNTEILNEKSMGLIFENRKDSVRELGYGKKYHEEKVRQEYRLGYAIGQVNKMFIISQSAGKLILVDQHAAHERIVLENIRNSFFKRESIRQILLIPEIVKVNQNKNLLFKNQEEINRLGIIFEDYGEDSVLVREIPSVLGKINIQHLLEDLLKNIKSIGSIDAKNSNIERIFSTIACHNSIRAGRKLNIEEMNSLLRLMEETANSGQCNHGRPTFIELSFIDIERLFGRT